MGGGETKTQTVENHDPWYGQQDYLKDAFSQAQGIYNTQKNQTPVGYSGDFTAQASPEQYSAFQTALGQAGGSGAQAVDTTLNAGTNLAGFGQGLTGASASGLYGMANGNMAQGNIKAAGAYANNPYMSGMVDASMADARRTAEEITLPGITRDAAASGNLNSTRGEIASGMVQRGLAEKAADISSNLRGQAWSQGLSQASTDQEHKLSALSSLGGMGSSATGMGLGALASGTDMASTNAQTAGTSTAMLQAFDQAKLDNSMQQFDYNQNLPWQNLQNYWSIVGDKSWGGQSTGTSTVKQNPSMLSSIGAGVGILGSLFKSDARIKHIYFEKGRTKEGLPMYVWSYKDDPNSRMYHGPMAQDVQKAIPEAVVEIDGILHIDLSKYDWR